MINKALFSSKTDRWATPQKFFDELNSEFHFDLDPCADETNHKTEKYFTKEQNGLLQDWGGASRVLQSTIRSGNRGVGRKSIQRGNKRRDNRCYADTRPHRYKIFSRLHIAQI